MPEFSSVTLFSHWPTEFYISTLAPSFHATFTLFYLVPAGVFLAMAFLWYVRGKKCPAHCADLLVLGFQTDTTRITTLKFNNDHSALRFPNLPSVQQVGHGIDYMIHHLLSHSDGEDWMKVNQFFIEQTAYIARKLDAIQEGPRTLLDNTMLLHCSSMMAGAKHDNDRN